MFKFHFFSISLERMNGFWLNFVYALIYMIHVVTNTHCFPELWPLIDFRTMFMLNILWNNWWIWSNLVDTLIFFLCQNMHNTKNKHSGGVSCNACIAIFWKKSVFSGFTLKTDSAWYKESKSIDYCEMTIIFVTFANHLWPKMFFCTRLKFQSNCLLFSY